MADNVELNAGSGGATIATDDDGTAQHQYVKLEFGGDGTFTKVSSAAPLPITVANTGANATAIVVDGSGVTQPVSGTVTANAGTNLNTSALALESGGNLATVAALSRAEDSAHASGNTGVMALAVREATATDLSAGNTDGDYEPLQVDASGKLWVNASAAAVPVTDNSGSLTVDNGGTFAVQATVAAGATNIAKAEDVASADADVGVPAMAVRKGTPANTSGTDGDYEMLQMSAGRLWVDASGKTLTVDASGVAVPVTDNGGTLSIDDGSGSITVDYATTGSGNATGALRVELANNGTGQLSTVGTVTTVSTVTTCSTLSTLTGGGVAHDGADSGNPVKVGAKAISSLKSTTTVSSADRTDNQSDLDGALLTRAQFPLGDLLSERVTDTGGSSTAFSNFSAVASTRNYVTAIVVNNSSSTAGTVDLRDGTGGSVLWTMPAPANGGAVVALGGLPLFRTSANTALAYDVSAAISTITISLSGFQSKV